MHYEDVKAMTDAALCNAYQRTYGEPRNPKAEVLLDGQKLRKLNVWSQHPYEKATLHRQDGLLLTSKD